jgi:hypothetical protein
MRPVVAGLVVVPLVVVGVLVFRGADTGKFPHVRAPANASTTPLPPPTAPVDLTAISLPGVDGTTTTAPVRATGGAHLSGVVKGPQGPVPGATVRLEHLVGGSAPATTDVASGPDGHYELANIAGGRYRVRAFLAPALAQTGPEVFFLADGELRGLDLRVESFSGLTVTASTAPDPPLLDNPATFVVRVATRVVDTRGIVRVQPIVNATVDLTGTAGWSVNGPASGVTGSDGDATFTIVCRKAGASGVGLQVRPTAADQPQPDTLATPVCVDPAATSTTATSTPSSPPSSPPAPN